MNMRAQQSMDFDLPEGILLSIPRDYATNVAAAPVRLLDEVCGRRLLVRWDDEEVQFVGPKGGCAYRRGGIRGFGLGRRKLHGLPMCELWVDAGEAYLPVLYSLAPDEAELREAALHDLVSRMVDAGVPLPPLNDTG